MKRFVINKRIMLSFLDQYGSSDFFITPMDNQFVIVDGNIVFYEVDGKREETNNTVGSLYTYIKNGYISRICEDE